MQMIALMTAIKQITDNILSLFFPNRCVGCGELIKVDGDPWICDKCREQFEIKEHRRCKICGRIIHHRGNCRICNSDKMCFDRGYAVFEYKGGVRKAIMDFKYKNMFRYGEFFGNIMSDFAKENIDEYFDYITAVPLHSKRKRDRGYNQSEILAKAIGRELGIKYKRLLLRKTNTKPQNSLNKKERLENIKKAFCMCRNVSVENKNILIIDDIFTTGSTINECSRILKENKAAKVEFFAISCRSDD